MNMPFAQPDEIEERTEQRIPDHVENGERRESVGIGLRAETRVVQDHRGKHRQHLPVHVGKQAGQHHCDGRHPHHPGSHGGRGLREWLAAD